MQKSFLCAVAAACAVVMAGCGGSGETVLGTEQNPRVRVLNFVNSPATTDISFDGELVADNSTFGSLGTYRIFRNGNRETVVRDANSQAVLAQQTNLYELSDFYTVAVANTDSGVVISRIWDDRDVPSGKAQIRFIHLGHNSGPVDVYITAPNIDLTGVTPTGTNVNFGASSTSLQAYTVVDPGNYQVRVTTPGTKNVLITEDVTLDDGASKTVYLRNSGTSSLFEVDDKL